MQRRKLEKNGKQDTAEEQPARQRILAAAFGAFAERGFANASTLEIATRAKVSKRELYSLFGNKQQMLVTCISERAERMQLPANWPVPQTRPQLQATLAEIGSVLLRELSDPNVIAVYRIAVAEAERAPEVAQTLDLYGHQAVGAALRQLLERAQAAGLVANGDPRQMAPRFMALLLEDVVLKLALGLAKRPGPSEIRRRGSDAAQALMALYPPRDPMAAQTVNTAPSPPSGHLP